MSKTEILFATGNPNKKRELQEILGTNYKVLSLEDIGFKEDIPEPFFTLEENSAEKAKVCFSFSNIPCIAEDAGLEIEALEGAPGVLSARYAGNQKSDKANIDLVLQKLEGIENRAAQFRCVITYFDGKNRQQFEGKITGTISKKTQGDKGFGYDPIFIPTGYTDTFAQLSSSVKNQISHRKKAVDKLCFFLQNNSLL